MDSIVSPRKPYAGCTCTACGAQWPDPPPTDGSDVFCDGLCEMAFRRGQATRSAFDPTPTWGVTHIAAPAACADDSELVRAIRDFEDGFRDKAAARRYLQANCPVIDLRSFDVPRGRG